MRASLTLLLVSIIISAAATVGETAPSKDSSIPGPVVQALGRVDRYNHNGDQRGWSQVFPAVQEFPSSNNLRAVNQIRESTMVNAQSSIVISTPSGKGVRVEKVSTDPSKPAREYNIQKRGNFKTFLNFKQ